MLAVAVSHCLLVSTHDRPCWGGGVGKRVRGVVWFVWFGMLLGFEATSFHGPPFLVSGFGWVLGGCGGFGVALSCVFEIIAPVVGGGFGGVGLLFGNCIVNASIL